MKNYKKDLIHHLQVELEFNEELLTYTEVDEIDKRLIKIRAILIGRQITLQSRLYALKRGLHQLPEND